MLAPQQEKGGNLVGSGIEMQVLDLARRQAAGGRVFKDRLIAELAARQLGVVGRKQLLAMGIGAGAIEVRLRRLQLHPLHRGVYAVGHLALLPLAREMAAVIACGPHGAAISHRSAARVWHLLAADERAPIDVTVAGASRKRPGLRVHKTRRLTKGDLRHLRGLPVTAPDRTLIDFAEDAADRELEQAVAEAITRRLVTADGLRAETGNYRGRRGSARLRRLLQHDDPPALTRSEAEERFLALVRAAQLPAPDVNARVGAYEVDFLWRDQALAVEIDGFRYHSSREAFERDRRRDGDLQSSGFSVLRITWRQLVGEPHATVARTVRALMSRRSGLA